MADHIAGTLKVNVDMSELDEATAKAERLLAPIDEIYARAERGNLTAPLRGNVQVRASNPQSSPPPKPKR